MSRKVTGSPSLRRKFDVASEIGHIKGILDTVVKYIKSEPDRHEEILELIACVPTSTTMSEMFMFCNVTCEDSVQLDGITGFTEQNTTLAKRKCLTTVSSVAKVINNMIPVCVLNPTPHHVTLYPNQTVCYFKPETTICGVTFVKGNISNSPNCRQDSHNTPLPNINLENSRMNEEQKQQMLDLISEYRDIFATSLKDLGTCDLIKYDIDTGSHPPIKKAPYRANAIKREQIREHIKQLLDADMIEPCDSSWSSPVLLVPKEDNKTRIVVDYRHINRVTTPSAKPITRQDDIIDSIGGSRARWFSCIDLKCAYSHLLLTDEAKKKAAFVTHDGLYCPKTLNFGLTSAPGTFSVMMSQVLQGLHDKCLVYIDDVICFSDTFKNHLASLRQIFDRLRKYNLKANPLKCQFGCQEVNFLGHIITPEGVKTSPKKIEIIQNYPVPTKTKNPSKTLKSFLGLANYYRRFCKDYAKIASCLYELDKKDSKFIWTEKHQESFDKLKRMLTSAPVLAYPIFDKEMILHCDASGTGLGAVLLQEQDGKERVISYAGRALTEAEKKYSATHREMLCIIWALEHFKVYLSDTTVKIYTDHAPLRFVENAKDPYGKLARWAMKLSQYRYKIFAKRGFQNGDADAISRAPFDEMNLTHEKQINVTDIFDKKDFSLEELQRNDAVWKPYFAYLEDNILPDNDKDAKRIVLESQHFAIVDNILCRMYRPRKRSPEYIIKQICIPAILKDEILKEVHSNPLATGGCHWGFDRTYALLLEKYFWFSMSKDAQVYCKTCQTCQGRKGYVKRNASMRSLPQTSRPFERVAMDFVTVPVSFPERYKYILVFVCAFTGYVECYPTRDQSALTVAKCLLDLFSRVGHIQYLLSDRAQCFSAEIVRELCHIFKTTQLKTSSYHAQSDMAERYVKTIVNVLAMFCCKNKKDWPSYLRSIVYALNTTPSTEGTCYSPFYLVYGRHAVTPLDIKFGTLPEGCYDVGDYIERVGENLNMAYKFAIQNKQAAEVKKRKYYDRKAKETHFAKGDIVFLYNPTPDIKGKGKGSLRGHKKMVSQRWKGPFHITHVFENGVNVKLRCCTTGKALPNPFHVNLLKRGYIRNGNYQPSEVMSGKHDTNHENYSGGKVSAHETKTEHSNQNTDSTARIEGKYEIKKILKSCYDYKRKCRLYRCWFVGLPKTKAVWLLADDVPQSLREAYHSVNTYYAELRYAKTNF